MKKNKTLQYVTVSIESDDSPANPRDEFDTLSTFYGPRNSHYSIGGKQDVELESWNLAAHIKEFMREGAIIESFRSNAGECFAVIERDAIVKEYKNDSRSSLYRARQVCKGEIKEYLAWANGEVYGYIITDKETGETLDSCWGFYGLEYCEEEAQSQAEYFDNDLAAKQQQVNTRLAIVAA